MKNKRYKTLLYIQTEILPSTCHIGLQMLTRALAMNATNQIISRLFAKPFYPSSRTVYLVWAAKIKLYEFPGGFRNCDRTILSYEFKELS